MYEHPPPASPVMVVAVGALSPDSPLLQAAASFPHLHFAVVRKDRSSHRLESCAVWSSGQTRELHVTSALVLHSLGPSEVKARRQQLVHWSKLLCHILKVGFYPQNIKFLSLE